jgi:hypothetical protein
MKKLLCAALLAALPSTAFAGVGATAHLSSMNDGTSWAPTIDYRAKGFLVQLDALSLLGTPFANNEDKTGDDFFPHDQLNFGVSASYAVLKKQCAPEIEGVFMPGLDIRYIGYIGDTGEALNDAEMQSGGANISVKGRFGMEMKKGAGFGVYVVPKLGVSSVPGIAVVAADKSAMNVTYGGGIEVSAWFNK